MSMHYLNLLSNNDVAEYREEGEEGWEGCGTVNDEERHVVYFETIREVSYASPFFVGMSDDYNFVAPINKLRRQLVDMTFDASRLGKEEVADHGNVVRHIGHNCCRPAVRIGAEGQEAVMAVVSW
jgi:hypothetical protein